MSKQEELAQTVKQSVRQVIFGFQENLLMYGPPGVGKVSLTLEEIRRHDTPHIHVMCSDYTSDDFWEFKRMLMADNDRLIVLDEANSLPPTLAELVIMWIEVYDRKGVIALAQSNRDGSNTHLCMSEWIGNQVTLSVN